MQKNTQNPIDALKLTVYNTKHTPNTPIYISANLKLSKKEKVENLDSALES